MALGGDGVLVDLSGKHVTTGSTEGTELCSGLTLAVIAVTCVWPGCSHTFHGSTCLL